MPTYYLRMEGVNLGAVFSDTNQISVIRGASFLLRNATQLLGKEDKAKFKEFDKISSGASIGLFSFTAENQEQAEQKRDEVAEHLREHKQFRHLTFVLDVQVASSVETDFERDKEILLARNRFRQMQQMTLVMPDKGTKKPHDICKQTNIAPATTKEKIGEEMQLVSSSLSIRLKEGREQKQQFYQDETGLELNFTQDLTDLSEPLVDTSDQLRGKVAVLYFDGNQFSKIQREHCKTKTNLEAFDQTVQNYRKKFLKDFLMKVFEDDKFLYYDKERDIERIRLETLLWGGDEMLFVVPAWKGFELLNYFYEFSQTWTFKTETLTHAGGLVFCRAKTPIRRIRGFAQELAEQAKNTDRSKNLFDYMALESIGYPSDPPEKLRQYLFPEALLKDYKALQPFSKQAFNALCALKESVPKTQAYALVRTIIDDVHNEAAFQEKKQRLQTLLKTKAKDPKQDALQDIEACLNTAFPNQTEHWRWIHFVELWDYLVSADSKSAAPTSAQ